MSSIDQMALIWLLCAAGFAAAWICVPLVRKLRRDAGPSYKADTSKPTGEAAAPVAASRLERISRQETD